MTQDVISVKQVSVCAFCRRERERCVNKFATLLSALHVWPWPLEVLFVCKQIARLHHSRCQLWGISSQMKLYVYRNFSFLFFCDVARSGLPENLDLFTGFEMLRELGVICV